MSDQMPREEGPLSDPRQRQGNDKAAARIRRIYRADLASLEGNATFRRWFGKYAVPMLMLDLRTTNGGDLQHFMGRRSLVLEMIREFEEEVPGFYERVLGVRRSLENEARPEPQKDED